MSLRLFARGWRKRVSVGQGADEELGEASPPTRWTQPHSAISSQSYLAKEPADGCVDEYRQIAFDELLWAAASTGSVKPGLVFYLIDLTSIFDFATGL
jgi:hypothetical protein